MIEKEEGPREGPFFFLFEELRSLLPATASAAAAAAFATWLVLRFVHTKCTTINFRAVEL
jgi:hypothetical protein